MAKIKGGAVKSMAGLKASLKKGAGSQYLTRVPSEESITVRFLTEPEEWYGYYEHYDAIRKFYPCSDDCPGCTEGDRPSGRYLASALDVAENRVVPLVLPKSAVSSLVKKHEKYGTMLDRDYEISRSGQGFDTEYDVTPEAPTKVNLSRYDLLDLEELLESQLNMAEASDAAVDDSDDDDDDVPIKSYRNAKAKKPAPVVDEEDDDDDVDDDDSDVVEEVDDEADDETADEGFSRDELLAMSLSEVKALAKDVGFTVPDLRGKDKDAVADLIMSIYDATDDDADAADDDDEEITEDQLRDMSLAEVKAIAKDMGIRMKAGIAKDDIIELILDAAGEEDDSDGDEVAPF
jgi:hypothetical protein